MGLRISADPLMQVNGARAPRAHRCSVRGCHAMLEPIGSVEEFYAHALAIEREAAKCYRGSRSTSRTTARRCWPGCAATSPTSRRTTTSSWSSASRALKVPELPPERYRWLESGPPETADHEVLFRLATPRQLLEIALKAEQRARRFFEWVAGTTASGEIHALADEMAREEAEHVQWVTPGPRVRARRRRRLGTAPRRGRRARARARRGAAPAQGPAPAKVARV